MHSGAMDKWFDAACRSISPALRVAAGGPSAASHGSTVAPATLFTALLADWSRPPR